jgi:hypothetical protein
LTSDGTSWANTQATRAASSKERPRCKERSAMVMGWEWLKGIRCVDTQIIRKSLHSRLGCAMKAQESVVVAAAGQSVDVDVDLMVGKRGGFKARGNIQVWRIEPQQSGVSWLKISTGCVQFTYFPLHLPIGITSCNCLSRQSSQCHPGSPSHIDCSWRSRRWRPGA